MACFWMSRGSRVWILVCLLRVHTYRPILPLDVPAIDVRSRASICCVRYRVPQIGRYALRVPVLVSVSRLVVALFIGRRYFSTVSVSAGWCNVSNPCYFLPLMCRCCADEVPIGCGGTGLIYFHM
eukprot:11931421-Ditylum_brightwellii.AAC.1